MLQKKYGTSMDVALALDKQRAAHQGETADMQRQHAEALEEAAAAHLAEMEAECEGAARALSEAHEAELARASAELATEHHAVLEAAVEGAREAGLQQASDDYADVLLRHAKALGDERRAKEEAQRELEELKAAMATQEASHRLAFERMREEIAEVQAHRQLAGRLATLLEVHGAVCEERDRAKARLETMQQEVPPATPAPPTLTLGPVSNGLSARLARRPGRSARSARSHALSCGLCFLQVKLLREVVKGVGATKATGKSQMAGADMRRLVTLLTNQLCDRDEMIEIQRSDKVRAAGGAGGGRREAGGEARGARREVRREVGQDGGRRARNAHASGPSERDTRWVRPSRRVPWTREARVPLLLALPPLPPLARAPHPRRCSRRALRSWRRRPTSARQLRRPRRPRRLEQDRGRWGRAQQRRHAAMPQGAQGAGCPQGFREGAPGVWGECAEAPQ